MFMDLLIKNKIWRISILLLVFTLSACDFFSQDLNIHSGYYVERVNDVYYLVHENNKASPGGVVDGIVLEIGWNDRYILVKRKTNAEQIQDFVIVDSSNQSLLGPYKNREEIPDKYKNIKTYKADYAWKNL